MKGSLKQALTSHIVHHTQTLSLSAWQKWRALYYKVTADPGMNEMKYLLHKKIDKGQIKPVLPFTPPKD